MCERKPTLKAKLGCDGPPIDGNGQAHTWDYPPEAPGRFPEHHLDRCPSKVLGDAFDIVELFNIGNMCEWKLSMSERDSMPAPYIDAWVLARNHTRMAESDRMRKK